VVAVTSGRLLLLMMMMVGLAWSPGAAHHNEIGVVRMFINKP